MIYFIVNCSFSIRKIEVLSLVINIKTVPDYYEQPDYLKDLYNTNPPLPENISNQVNNNGLNPISPVQNPNNPAPQPVTAPTPVQPQPIVPPPIPPINNVPSKTNTKKNKRKLIILAAIIGVIILVVVILLLVTRKDSTTQVKENIVLQWWGAFLDEETVQPLLDEYREQNPHVTIEYANRFRNTETYADEVTRYQNELNRVLKAGNPVEIPDIFTVDSTWVGDYERYSRISNSYDITTFRNSFYNAVVTNFTKNNQVYGVPLWMDTFAVLYNKDLLAQNSVQNPPTNWSSFKALAQALTRSSNNTITQAGFAAGTATNVNYATDIFQILMKQNGVTIADETGKPQFASDPNAQSALAFYKSFLTNPVTWSTAFTNDSAAFLEGKVAMIIVPSYRYREILRFNEHYEIGLDIGVSELPQVDGSTQDFNGADYWGNMVANNRPNSTESWKFLHWITQPEQLRKLSENVKDYNKYFGLIYPRKDMNSELISDEYLRIFNEGALNAQAWYMIKGLQIEEEIAKTINNTNPSTAQLESLQKNIDTLRATQGQF